MAFPHNDGRRRACARPRLRSAGAWRPRFGGCRELLVLGAFLLLAPGCGRGGAEVQPGEGEKAVTVEVARVEPQVLRDVATFSGQLDAEFSVVVKSETDGIVEELLFEEGQTVEKDAVLYRLRSVEQAARLREALANEVLARAEFERVQGLASRNAASLAQKDQRAAELEVARARVALGRVALERTQIRAPFDGVVGMRLVSPGDRITDETPLVQIDAIDRLQLSFATSEHGIAFAEPGAKIELRVAPYPGEVFVGEVFFVSPTLNPATRRLILKAWVPNADHRLRPGLFANVDLELARRESALMVPESAIVFDRHGTYVWKLVGRDAAERLPVELGLRQGGRVEVTLGLHPGDTIVTAGTHKVSEGKKLRAKATPSSSQASRSATPAGGEGS